MFSFAQQNPELLPLEDLKLKTSTGGVVEHVDALVCLFN